ncbi:unnamed protein product [Pseudo-nitzschia multistriata]|uniref:Myb-like domain-containing protein n=1 Tax=Pseudo-nitzschia multistriata TaxID=183589 RepID=A0A448ZFV0_9STRA|nr:unnamed protein product [Pseudo-nitzschia multistriata]
MEQTTITEVRSLRGMSALGFAAAFILDADESSGSTTGGTGMNIGGNSRVLSPALLTPQQQRQLLRFSMASPNAHAHAHTGASTNPASTKRSLETTIATDLDVVLGRKKSCPSRKEFRRLIGAYAPEYQSAGTSTPRRNAIVEEIRDRFRNGNGKEPKRRFLRPLPKQQQPKRKKTSKGQHQQEPQAEELCVELDEREFATKIRQALKEKRSAINKSYNLPSSKPNQHSPKRRHSGYNPAGQGGGSSASSRSNQKTSQGKSGAGTHRDNNGFGSEEEEDDHDHFEIGDTVFAVGLTGDRACYEGKKGTILFRRGKNSSGAGSEGNDNEPTRAEVPVFGVDFGGKGAKKFNNGTKDDTNKSTTVVLEGKNLVRFLAIGATVKVQKPGRDNESSPPPQGSRDPSWRCHGWQGSTVSFELNVTPSRRPPSSGSNTTGSSRRFDLVYKVWFSHSNEVVELSSKRLRAVTAGSSEEEAGGATKNKTEGGTGDSGDQRRDSEGGNGDTGKGPSRDSKGDKDSSNNAGIKTSANNSDSDNNDSSKSKDNQNEKNCANDSKESDSGVTDESTEASRKRPSSSSSSSSISSPPAKKRLPPRPTSETTEALPEASSSAAAGANGSQNNSTENNSNPDNDSTKQRDYELYPIGTRTKKFFPQVRAWFQGTIKSYNPESGFYSIEYEDGDREELEHYEVATGLLPPHKYDIGFSYQMELFSKIDGSNLGWFDATVQGKCYVSQGKARGWRYQVVYSDGDEEDVIEKLLTKRFREARHHKNEGASNAIKKNTEVNPNENIDATTERGLETPPNKVVEERVKNDEDSSCSSSCDKDENVEEDLDEDEDDSEESSSSGSEDNSDQPNKSHEKVKTRIPHWSGKEHDRFFVGLLEYGYGNLEDIHEAGCIPSRSFRELVRYWRWFRADLEQKGIDIDFDRRGTVNGKKGTKFDPADLKEQSKPSEDDHETPRTGPWSEWEKQAVVKAFAFHGSSYKEMSEFMKTRTANQIASYCCHNKAKIKKEVQKCHEQACKQANSPGGKRGSPTSENGTRNGNRRVRRRADAAVDEADDKGYRSWTSGEHEALVSAMASYGHQNYDKQSLYVKSRSPDQIRKYVRRNTDRLTKAANSLARENRRLQATKAHLSRQWSDTELGLLVEAHALYGNDCEMISAYVGTRSVDQVKTVLENYEDYGFDLGYYLTFPDELYHVLNVAPFENLDHILSWSSDGKSFLIHDEEKFRTVVFPRYSRKGTSSDRFYGSLKRFGFSREEPDGGAEQSVAQYSHPSFRRGQYKKVLEMPHQVYSSSITGNKAKT